MSKRILSAAASLLLVLLLCMPPVSVQAAQTRINSVDIKVELQLDGSALFTEVWDVDAISDMTEWYLERTDLGKKEISDLKVTDETGKVFEPQLDWNVDASIEEKAGKSGILETDKGYELCWGIGSLGHHVFTAQYTMTNLVQGYSDADAIYHRFLSGDLSSPPQAVSLTIEREGVPFTKDNTGIWAYGREGMEYKLKDGQIVLNSPDGLRSSEYVVMLVEFKTGMFTPLVTNNRTFGELLKDANKGSNYGTDYSGGMSSISVVLIIALIGVVGAVFLVLILSLSSSYKVGKSRMKPEYKNGNYSREIPWRGNLSATYTRLTELRQLPDEGTIIGAYILRWIYTRQVEVTTQQENGFFGSKEAACIKLFAPRPEMETLERRLYDMLISAAGPDWILQSKEFEKWSQKHFEMVQGWLEEYKIYGANVMRMMGAFATQEVKVFFNLIPTQQTVVTPIGDEMTTQMFGFKKYLEDFTIINEREAREVELWEEYLVFAQVFGIAEKVADQFKQLYPDYFRQMATQLGAGNIDAFDMYLIFRMSNSFGHSMYQGYRAGYTAHINRDSGGGGFSSGGGGFSAGGGGGGGGR